MRFAPVVLAVLCALTLFTGLGRIGLVDQREARDAQVARELIAEREILTPILGREPLFDKPILAYAPEVAARLATTTPVVTSRRLRALLAMLVVVLAASIAAEYFGTRAAWFTSFVLATSLALPLAARTDGTQAFATLLGWVGCAGFADALFGRRAGRGLRLVVSYVALAIALLWAGPLAALWPLLGLGVYVTLARVPDGWSRVRPLAGLTVLIGLALPWYGAMLERHGALFAAHAPFFPYAAEARGPWFAGPMLMLSLLVLGFYPWSALLPGAMLHAAVWWRRVRRPTPFPIATPRDGPAADPVSREQREESAAHFFVACLVAALLPVALYPGPPLPAVLPALPAAALLCGRFLDHLYEDPDRLAPLLGRAVLMLALVGGVGGVMLAMVAGRVREATPELRLIGTVVFVTSWLPFLANFLGRRRLAAALVMLPVAVGTPLVAYRALPTMEGYLNTREVAAAMNSVSPPFAPLVVAEPPPPSLRLYARRNLIVGVPLAGALERFRATDGLAYVAFRPARERDVVHAARGPLEIVLRTPSLVLARVHE